MSDRILQAIVKGNRILNTALTKAFDASQSKCIFLKRGLETFNFVQIVELPEGWLLEFPRDERAPIDANGLAVLTVASEREYLCDDGISRTVLQIYGVSTHVAVGAPEKGSYPVYRLADSLIKDEIAATGTNPEHTWYLQREPRQWW